MNPAPGPVWDFTTTTLSGSDYLALTFKDTGPKYSETRNMYLSFAVDLAVCRLGYHEICHLQLSFQNKDGDWLKWQTLVVVLCLSSLVTLFSVLKDDNGGSDEVL